MTYNIAPRAGDDLRLASHVTNTGTEFAPPGQHEQPGLLAEQLTAVVQDIITTQHRSARQRGAAGRRYYDGGEVRSVYFGHKTDSGQRLTLSAWAALDKDGRVRDPHIIMHEVDEDGIYTGKVRLYCLDTTSHSNTLLAEPQVFCYEHDTADTDDAFVPIDKAQPTEVDGQELAEVCALLQHATVQSPEHYAHRALNKVRSMLPWHERWGLTAIHIAEQMAQRALQLVG